jgi:hypothetical protein
MSEGVLFFHVPILAVFICMSLLGLWLIHVPFCTYFRRQRDYQTTLFTRLSMVMGGNLHDGRSSYPPVIFVQVCLDDSVLPQWSRPDIALQGAVSVFLVNVVIHCWLHGAEWHLRSLQWVDKLSWRVVYLFPVEMLSRVCSTSGCQIYEWATMYTINALKDFVLYI